MTSNFRKTVTATTMLAGFAIFAIDTAQAGPNGGPSLGSISGFSSMRMDFNRIGGPGRALSRDDMRVVPLEVKKTIPSGIKPLPGKKDDKKDIAKKKDTNVARVSNPKSSTGRDDKPGVQNGTNLPINPNVIAEQIDVAALAERIRLGPLTVGNLVFPTPGFEWPAGEIPGPDQGTSDPDELRKRGEGPGNAPGGPNTSKTGWAGSWIVVNQSQGDGYRDTSYYDPATGRYGTVRHRSDGGDSSREITVGGNETSTDNEWTVRTTHHDANGTHTRRTDTTDVIYGNNENEVAVVRSTTIETTGEGPTSQAANEEPYYQEPGPKDSQPSEGYSARGMGRPDSICGPAGCWVGDHTSRRQILTRDPDGSTARTARRQSPGWASDPNPEGIDGGSGGGRTGYTPQDEEGGDIGGPGNPALDGLIAAL